MATELTAYDPSSTLREARARYFETNGFGVDGGYAAKWVPVKVGPAEFVIRNSAGRRRAVPLHDLHHIATGYPTTLEGEALIGAWELGSGCRDHWAAWFLNANAFSYGLILAPRALWTAFVRGRHSYNLYGGLLADRLLDGTVAELRTQLGVDEPADATRIDILAFAFWVAVGVYLLAWNVLLAPVLALATVGYKFTRRVPGAVVQRKAP
jgi:hypothetical protein